jgi:hypothetical protein
MGNVEKLQEARDKINGIWPELVENVSDHVLLELNDALKNIIFVQEDLEKFYNQL